MTVPAWSRILVVVSVLAAVPGCSNGSPPSPSAIVCPIVPSGTAYVLNHETLRVMFSVVANSAWNLLITDVGLVSGASTAFALDLFNGNVLLGSQPGNGDGAWRSASSPESGTTVDFSAIQNGSIDGRLDYVVNGEIRVDLTRVTVFTAIASSNSPFPIGQNATIRSLALVSTSCH